MSTLRSFNCKEGILIISVSEEIKLDLHARTITETGRFTSGLVGGTIPDFKVASVRDGQGDEERIFRSEQAALNAALDLAKRLGYHVDNSNLLAP